MVKTWYGQTCCFFRAKEWPTRWDFYTSVVDCRFPDLVFLLVHKSTEKASGLSISGFDHVTRLVITYQYDCSNSYLSVKVAVYTYSISTNHEKLNVSSGGHYELHPLNRSEEVCWWLGVLWWIMLPLLHWCDELDWEQRCLCDYGRTPGYHYQSTRNGMTY